MLVMEKGKDFAVNLVNSRLRVFNRPFLLASLISAFQLSLLAVIFLLLKENCEKKQIVAYNAADMMLAIAEREVLKRSRICFERAVSLSKHSEPQYQSDAGRALSDDTRPWIVPTSELSQVCTFLPEDNVNFCADRDWHGINEALFSVTLPASVNEPRVGHCPYRPSTGCIDVVNEYLRDANGASIHKGLETKLYEQGCLWACAYFDAQWKAGLNEFSIADYDKHEHCREQHCETLWDGQCRGTEDQRCDSYCADFAGQQVLYYQECPDEATILGVTLGFAGYLEFGLTVFFVGLLWATGIIDTKNSPMTTWVRNYISTQGDNAAQEAKDRDSRINTLEEELRVIKQKLCDQEQARLEVTQAVV